VLPRRDLCARGDENHAQAARDLHEDPDPEQDIAGGDELQPRIRDRQLGIHDARGW
jgi:hypothetical protein